MARMYLKCTVTQSGISKIRRFFLTYHYWGNTITQNINHSRKSGNQMAQVVQATLWNVAPGKDLDFIETNKRAKKIHMRLGAANAMLTRVNVGENPGQYIYNMVFESGTAYGKFVDAIATDSEWMALWIEAVGKQLASPAGNRLSTIIEI
jgi:hypothetical protein